MVRDALPLTGERTLPGIAHENYWFMRHVVAYELAAARAPGRRVLDAGCGEGYGARMLAARGARVVGVDLAPEVVAHARRAYPDLPFVQADLAELPFHDGSFDLVVSLQVIEHLQDIPGFVAQLARVLRPGGELVVATPNRLTFSPGHDTPVNPFHTRELTAVELREVLSPHVRVRTVLGLHHGARLRAVEHAAGRTLADLLRTEPQDRPRWLSGLVARVGVRDFRWRATDLDGSLDLVAVAVAPA